MTSGFSSAEWEKILAKHVSDKGLIPTSVRFLEDQVGDTKVEGWCQQLGEGWRSEGFRG